MLFWMFTLQHLPSLVSVKIIQIPSRIWDGSLNITLTVEDLQRMNAYCMGLWLACLKHPSYYCLIHFYRRYKGLKDSFITPKILSNWGDIPITLFERGSCRDIETGRIIDCITNCQQVPFSQVYHLSLASPS